MITFIDNRADTCEQKMGPVLEPHLNGDITMVSVCYKRQSSDNLQEFRGIDEAIRYAAEGKNVVVWGPVPEIYVEQKRGEAFTSLVALPNVAYMVYPFSAEEFAETANSLINGTKAGNAAVAAAGQARIREKKIAVFRHRYVDYDRRPDDEEAFLKEAATLGFTGTVEEIRDALRTWKRETHGNLAGQRFAGTFFDVQGTLVAEDGTLKGEVVAMMEEVAQSGPITVWTDGDVKSITTQLRALGVKHPVVSKFDFHGATVEKAVDDKSEDEFIRLYGITPESFLQV